MASPPSHDADLAVVGAGAAGLYAALCAADAGARVALVSATPLAESSSYWAQGGLAAALADEDSPDRHLADTVRAGRGLVRETAARRLVDEAPAVVADLQARGVRFDSDRRGHLSLGLEGGHSARRVAHAGGSATGRRVTRALSALVAEHAGIAVHEGAQAGALMLREGRCTGLRAGALALHARAVILATGGAAALWARTTNPAGAIGGGMLLAHAAGAALADLELVQFHPTALALPGRADGFLVTEAVRGEGARLLDATGARFVDELAPRDEVARAIGHRIAHEGSSAVSLDMRGVEPALFPNVVEVLREVGIDPVRDLVPVAPAAHYVMGGIVSDAEGRTSVPGLYAVGECACSGLHGANRLASNSLSECFVFGRRAALAALAELPSDPSASSEWRAAAGSAPTPATRAALWRHAGLERDAPGLCALLGASHPLARLVAQSALTREESRGAHQRSDFPATDPALGHRHVVLAPGAPPAITEWR